MTTTKLMVDWAWENAWLITFCFATLMATIFAGYLCGYILGASQSPVAAAAVPLILGLLAGIGVAMVNSQ